MHKTAGQNANFLYLKKIVANILPFFETNWEVTPTSNVANTGEWSLVMISLVHPKKSKSNIG